MLHVEKELAEARAAKVEAETKAAAAERALADANARQSLRRNVSELQHKEEDLLNQLAGNLGDCVELRDAVLKSQSGAPMDALAATAHAQCQEFQRAERFLKEVGGVSKFIDWQHFKRCYCEKCQCEIPLGN